MMVMVVVMMILITILLLFIMMIMSSMDVLFGWLSLFGYDHENDYIHDHAHVRVDFHDHIHDYENDHKHYLLQYDLSENFLKQEVIISLCYHLNELNNNSLFILSDW